MINSGTKSKGNVLTDLHKRLFLKYKKGEMGYATIAIIGQSCLGSSAAMALLMGALDTAVHDLTVFCDHLLHGVQWGCIGTIETLDHLQYIDF